MWDTLITLAIVAGAVVFVARRLFLTPHCGGKDSECQHCPQSANTKNSQEVDL